MTSSSKTYSTDNQDLLEGKSKSPFTAYVALLLTGAFGGHRHYLGYSGTGFLQTLLGLITLISVFLSWPYLQGFLSNPEVAIITDDNAFKWVVTALGSIVLLGLWLLSDLLRIPALTERKNQELLSSLSNT